MGGSINTVEHNSKYDNTKILQKLIVFLCAYKNNYRSIQLVCKLSLIRILKFEVFLSASAKFWALEKNWTPPVPFCWYHNTLTEPQSFQSQLILLFLKNLLASHLFLVQAVPDKHTEIFQEFLSISRECFALSSEKIGLFARILPTLSAPRR